MARPNNVIVEDFISNIREVVSKDSSDKYILAVFKGFIEKQEEFFPFLKYVKVDMNTVKVDKAINSTDQKLVARFINVMINTLFSELFMLLLKRKIPKELATDLETLGIRLQL